MATPSEAEADVKGLQTARAVHRRPWALSSRRRWAQADSHLEVSGARVGWQVAERSHCLAPQPMAEEQQDGRRTEITSPLLVLSRCP